MTVTTSTRKCDGIFAIIRHSPPLLFGGADFHTLYKHGKLGTEPLPPGVLHRMYMVSEFVRA